MTTTAQTPRSKKGAPAWAHPAIALGVRAGIATINVSDHLQSLAYARRLGTRFAQLPFNRRRLQRALDHLAVAFPHADEHERRRLAVSAYSHLFQLAVETAVAPRMLSADAWHDHISLTDLDEGLRTLLCSGPCIMLTGHCGNWEVLGYTLAMLGFPMHALYRPLDLKPLDRWVRTTRQRHGMVLLDKFGAAERLPRILEQGGTVGFVADQNAGDRGLFVPFFDKLASTYKTIGLLAMRYDAPIICGQARRLTPSLATGAFGSARPDPGPHPTAGGPADPFSYSIEIADIIRPAEWRDAPDPLFYITARYRRAIERMVRSAPEQYLWMHRCWKSRPRFERDHKPFPETLRDKLAQLPWTDEASIARTQALSTAR